MSIIVVLWRDFGLTRVVVPVLVTLSTTTVVVSTLLLLVVAVVFLLSTTLLYVAEWVGRLRPTTIVVGFLLMLLTILFVRGLFYVEGLPMTFVVVERVAPTKGWLTSLCSGGVPFGFREQVRYVTAMYDAPFSGGDSSVSSTSSNRLRSSSSSSRLSRRGGRGSGSADRGSLADSDFYG